MAESLIFKVEVQLFVYIQYKVGYFNGFAAPVGQNLFVFEVLRSHFDTPHSVGAHWKSDWLVAETST
jgi:hypothetical protein